jgi:hypothetical protein
MTPDQAAQFRDHVIAREPYHLRELASWLDQTGGPLDEMDASTASLTPLWEWSVDLARAGFLGLTDGLVPADDPRLESLQRADPAACELARQSRVVGERLMHYLRLVVTRVHPPTRWDVERTGRAGDSGFQETALFLPGRTYEGREWGIWVHLVRSDLEAAVSRGDWRPDELARLVVPGLPPDLRPRRQERLSSVLRPYLEADLPPAPEAARVSPVLAWRSAPPQPRTAASPSGDWEDLILAKGPGEGLEEPRLLEPLPADRVLAALREGGFTDLTVQDLLDEADVAHPGDVAHLMTLAHRGTLRALHLQPVDPDEDSWVGLVAPLRMLAVELGANLVPEGDYPD